MRRTRMSYSRFSHQEYLARSARVKKMLSEEDIDALLLTQKENVEYFSGLLSSIWDCREHEICCVLPKDGEPVLVVPRFIQKTCKETSWVENVSPYLDNMPDTIVKSLKEMGLTKARIGVESGPSSRVNMSLQNFEKLKFSIPEAQFVDATETIWKNRMIKTQPEIEYLKKAVAITCRAIEKCFQSLRVGMTELDVARITKISMLEEGADPEPLPGFIVTRSGQKRSSMAESLPTTNKLKEGDILLLDTGAKFNGYYADLARMAHVGRIREGQKEVYDICLEANIRAISAIRPGATISDIFETGWGVVRERYEPARKEGILLGEIGHGVGLDVHEPPLIDSTNEGKLEPGMIVTIEPIIFDSILRKEGLATFFVEDEVLVTSTGRQVLSRTLQKEELWEIR
jgi:Xaa-Pro aminopeptidase